MNTFFFHLYFFLGAIFEQGTILEQSIFKHALMNYNHNGTNRRFELQAFVDVINTADAFKLSRLSKYKNKTVEITTTSTFFFPFHFLLVHFHCLSCLCFFHSFISFYACFFLFFPCILQYVISFLEVFLRYLVQFRQNHL